jgi:hypothetical protein
MMAFKYNLLFRVPSRLEYVATIWLLYLDSLSIVISLRAVSWYVGATAWNICVVI